VRDVVFLRLESNRRSQGCCTNLDTEFSNCQGAYDLGSAPQEETLLGVRPTAGSRSKIRGLRTNPASLGMRPDLPVLGLPATFIAYLEYDPFIEIGLENTKCNETQGVAFLCPDAPVSIGQKISHFRMKSRKTRKQFASELGVSVKTLWGWETDRRLPSELLKKRIGDGLFL
jgi:DNA-binding XRE family transcriptional regulator